MSKALSFAIYKALGKNAILCESRSLLLNKFNPLENRVSDKLSFLERIVKIKPSPQKLKSWKQCLLNELNITSDNIVFAKLRASLLLNDSFLVNFPGNSISLERFSGVPLISGQAIKSCARRVAIEKLRDSNADSKTDLAMKICSVFGLAVSDLADTSDIAWACGLFWKKILPEINHYFISHHRDRELQSQCESTIYFGLMGKVRFLPAFPWELADPDLSVEVLSCHHNRYYETSSYYSENKRVNLNETLSQFSEALDIERPEVEHILGISAGSVFAFPIVGEKAYVDIAKNWLMEGLAIYGIGSRTNSGFGWFDASSEIQSRYAKDFDSERAVSGFSLSGYTETEVIADEKKETKSTVDLKLSVKETENQTNVTFLNKLNNFSKLSDEEKRVLVNILRAEKREVWEDIKTKARKGHWARIEQEIRLFAKKTGLGKMP
jgi:CRISPR type III-B/RAMP module RAMP protein Cmr6